MSSSTNQPPLPPKVQWDKCRRNVCTISPQIKLCDLDTNIAKWGGSLTVVSVSIFGNLTLPETNSSHLKMDGWKMKFPFGEAYFQGQTVSFREGIDYDLVALFCEPISKTIVFHRQFQKVAKGGDSNSHDSISLISCGGTVFPSGFPILYLDLLVWWLEKNPKIFSQMVV